MYDVKFKYFYIKPDFYIEFTIKLHWDLDLAHWSAEFPDEGPKVRGGK